MLLLTFVYMCVQLYTYTLSFCLSRALAGARLKHNVLVLVQVLSTVAAAARTAPALANTHAYDDTSHRSVIVVDVVNCHCAFCCVSLACF